MTNNFAALALADRYAILKADIDALTKQLDAIKAEIKASGVETLVGDQAVVTVSLYERSTLDSKAAKALLTKEQIKLCSKVTLVEKITIAPRVATVLA